MRCLFLFIFLTTCLYSQESVDKLVLNSGDTLFVNISEVGVKVIKYEYPNSSVVYYIKRKKVNKIIHLSGREDIFNESRISSSNLKKNFNSKKEDVFDLFNKIQTSSSSFKKFFEFGLIGGVSSNSFRGTSGRDDYWRDHSLGLSSSNLSSSVFGFIFRYNFQNELSIRSNLIFHNRGEVITRDENITFMDNTGFELGTTYLNYNVKRIFNYITCPVLIEYNIRTKPFTFFINSGIYFSKLLGVDVKYDPETITNPLGTIIDLSLDVWNQPISDYNRFDFGIISGFGFSHSIGKNLKLSYEVSSDYGLVDLMTIEEEEWVSDQYIHKNLNLSRSFSIVLTYCFEK